MEAKTNGPPHYDEPPPPYVLSARTVGNNGRSPYSAYSNTVHYTTNQLSSPLHGSSGPAVVIQVNSFGAYPKQVTCGFCRAHVMTETNVVPGLLTFLLSGGLCLIGWVFCFCIPCFIDAVQDVEHRCPNCKAHLGTFKRL